MSGFFGRIVAGAAILVAVALPARAEIDIQVVTSPGGITAWLYEDHTLPMLNIEADFRGGTALDPEGQGGAVNLMMGLLEEGTGDMDSTAFAEATESLAAVFGFDASRDSVSVSAQMLTENREASLDLFRAALQEPRFDEVAFRRVQGQVLSILRSDETDPDTIARDTFYEKVFAGQPYARPSYGTEESVTALDVEAIRAAHGAALVRDRLKVSVVGDITADELKPILDQLFADLPVSTVERPGVTDPQTNGSMTVVDLDIPQSIVFFGQPGIARDDPDFIPAFVMDQILGGGGFGSRLTEEVREKRGLTYGIYTYLSPGDLGWLYVGGFSSANGVVADAINIVRHEWERMADEGVTARELEDAQKYLTGAYPLRFDGNGRIANQLLGLQVSDLGIDYVNNRNDLVNAVTVEDIKRVAARVMQPDQLTWVVVGRPEGLEATN